MSEVKYGLYSADPEHERKRLSALKVVVKERLVWLKQIEDNKPEFLANIRENITKDNKYER